MKKEIRVLCVFSRPDRGGAETMFMNLYRKIDREKVQFDIVKHTSDTCDYEEEIIALGGKVFAAPKLRLTNYFEYTKWWKNHFKEHPEHQIIHIHFFTITAAIAPIAHKFNRFVIGHCHSAGIKSLVEKAIVRIGGSQVDYAFACSEDAGRLMYGNKEFHVLNNAIDTEEFKFDQIVREKARNENGLTDTIVLGHIGRFYHVKNHLFLIDVFAETLKKNGNCKLMLVGDGPLRGDIENRAKEYGVLDDILFMGVRSDVNELIQAMDVFVFPSFYEGLSVVLVEAQTSGLPCVISDTISKEAILTNDLVTIKSLSDTAGEWAECILSILGEERFSRADEVKAQGYDIYETVHWLENFYLEHYN